MAWLLGIRARPDPKEMFLGSKDDISDPSPSLSSSSFLFLFSFGEEYWVSFDRTTISFVTWGPLGTPISRHALCSFLHRTQVERRAGLETFGLVHEHKCGHIFYVSCTLPEVAKKTCAKDPHGGAHHHGRDACRLRGGRRWRCSRVVDPHHDRRGERRSSFASFPLTFPTMCPNVNR